jgi:hypothetical protein
LTLLTNKAAATFPAVLSISPLGPNSFISSL